ncbi:MAG: hypothetical protein JNJ88_19325 [Planctomycetes bacterium]|nr:hypothetical protein [Planctomycetota bacterium]
MSELGSSDCAHWAALLRGEGEDARLGSEAAAALSAHLLHCEFCARELEADRHLSRELASITIEPLDRELVRLVARRVARAQRGSRWRLGLTLAAAALAMSVALDRSLAPRREALPVRPASPAVKTAFEERVVRAGSAGLRSTLSMSRRTRYSSGVQR